MANRTFSRVQALNHGVKVISGTIKCGAIADDNDGVNNAELKGLGYVPSIGATGEIEINLGGSLTGQGNDGSQTLPDPDDKDLYVDLISAQATAGPIGVALASTVNVVSQSVSTDGKVTFRIMHEDAAGDQPWHPHPMAENDEFMFTLVLRNSSADSR